MRLGPRDGDGEENVAEEHDMYRLPVDMSILKGFIVALFSTFGVFLDRVVKIVKMRSLGLERVGWSGTRSRRP